MTSHTTMFRPQSDFGEPMDDPMFPGNFWFAIETDYSRVSAYIRASEFKWLCEKLELPVPAHITDEKEVAP